MAMRNAKSCPCDWLLIAFWAIFFTIQTIYANLNPQDSGPVDVITVSIGDFHPK